MFVLYKPNPDMKKESLNISPSGASGRLISFTGKSGGFSVCTVPSLNVSGYGKSDKESFDDMIYNLKLFLYDLFQLSHTLQDAQLSKLGWTKENFFNKRYAASFVDDSGVLQNFDHPDEVEKKVIDPLTI